MGSSEGPIFARRLAGAAAWQWVALVVGVAVLVVALVARLGSEPKTVAKVNGTSITLSQYRHWLGVAAIATHSAETSLPNFAPDPPKYTRCVSFLRNSDASKGSAASLINECKGIETTDAEDVMQMLISGQWILDQGKREGIVIGPATVASQLAKSLKTAFPKGNGEAQMMHATGENAADLSYQEQVSLTASQLESRHVKTPTATAISSYYSANSSDFKGETLAQATPTIQATLSGPQTEAYLEKIEKYWKPFTSCATGYAVVYYCKSI
ncbi:MAG TPA: hypothetical protein VHX88_06235 [Solirubrobacteraceae bacterium]|jgi:hypothetical protein|nr:hypothetical protein [Solirubrobacteraceae bacterium]